MNPSSFIEHFECLRYCIVLTNFFFRGRRNEAHTYFLVASRHWSGTGSLPSPRRSSGRSDPFWKSTRRDVRFRKIQFEAGLTDSFEGWGTLMGGVLFWYCWNEVGVLFWYCWNDGGTLLILLEWWWWYCWSDGEKTLLVLLARWWGYSTVGWCLCGWSLSLVLCDRRRFRTGSLEYVGVFCFWGYVIGGSLELLLENWDWRRLNKDQLLFDSNMLISNLC
jgi:hypothetical protein